MKPRATIEEWRPTHDPRYEVSNLGRADNLEYGTRQDNVNDMMQRRGHWRHINAA